MKARQQYTLRDLTKDLEVVIRGDADCLITGVATIQQAQSNHITFLTNALYRKYLESTQAGAVILTESDAADCHDKTIVISRHPHYTYAKIAAYFEPATSCSVSGIHPTATLGANCVIDPSAVIGANCVVGDHVTLGANVVLGAGVIIGNEVSIGEGSQLDAHVTIYHGVTIGQRSRLASGVVVGSDGFGFAQHRGGWHKVPQLGGVVIGDEVDIGANTVIDRGAIEDTIIEHGVKLDNLIQVGHNVKIGENTIIAGCVAIAGSTTIGKNCMIGGATCFAGHLTVCDGAIMTGMTTVTKSITEPGLYSSGIVGAVPNLEFRKNNARFHRLEQLAQRVKSLETAMKDKHKGEA